MSNLAAPPDVLRWTPRYEFEHGDCAISALAIAGGVTYELALTSALKVAPDVLVNGMSWEEIYRAARILDLNPRLVRKGKYELDEATDLPQPRQAYSDDLPQLRAQSVDIRLYNPDVPRAWLVTVTYAEIAPPLNIPWYRYTEKWS